MNSIRFSAFYSSHNPKPINIFGVPKLFRKALISGETKSQSLTNSYKLLTPMQLCPIECKVLKRIFEFFSDYSR